MYRIFFCEEICHIYFYTHFKALCFTAEADDSLIPVLPFPRPLYYDFFFIASMVLIYVRNSSSLWIKGRLDILHWFSWICIDPDSALSIMQAHSCVPFIISWCREPRDTTLIKYKEIFLLANIKKVCVVPILCIFFIEIKTYMKNHGCHNSKELLFRHMNRTHLLPGNPNKPDIPYFLL